MARKAGRRTVFTLTTAMAVAALVGAAATRSWTVLVLALGILVMLHMATLLDLRSSRLTLHALRRQLDETQRNLNETQLVVNGLRRAQASVAVAAFDQAKASGVPPHERVPFDLAADVADVLLKRGDVLDAYALAAGTQTLSQWRVGKLRKLRESLRERGYLTKAIDVGRTIELLGSASERDVRAHKKIRGEMSALSGGRLPTVPIGTQGYSAIPGRILHVVGRSLPDHQVGYSIRTHHIVIAQRNAGLDPHVVTQPGFPSGGGDPVETVLDGITHYRLPGPRRGQEPLDEWLERYARQLADLVRRIRPAVLHAASDYVNPQAAVAVGRAFGIPVVYETRGFWEETWLSRNTREYGWDLDQLAATHGLPDRYLWQLETEDRLRREADHVVTLADVMADRIEAGGVPRDRIRVIPNGVAPEDFPLLSRDQSLAQRLGIRPEATVIGYISSLVEYEGIDTLLDAYAMVRESSPGPLALLIVGDGLAREQLMQRAAGLGLDQAAFTGRVPYQDVLGYYSLIDLFVVPRRPVEVCHLVTPLKPFEAFSTGRTVVLSDVRALAGIAEQSGAAELFQAGNARSLADTLLALLKDPQRRRELAEKGAAWVRAERSWAANAQAYLRLYEEICAEGGPEGAPGRAELRSN